MSATDINKVAQENNRDLEKLAVDGITPAAVATPATNEEAARVLKEANEAGKKVAIRGGGTKIGLGNPVKALDLVLSTANLNQILEYQPADLTLSVQGGASLSAIQAELEKHGQFLPVESPLAGQATIGGAVAANSSGPTRLQYGPARDWIIGVRFALADGTIAHAGGRVVKNVAGFDLMKLFAGSLGTLGLILEMNFKLLPQPKASATLVIPVPGEREGSELALKIIDRGLFPISETLLDEHAATALGLPARPTLLVEVRNTAQAVERQVRDINELAHESGAANCDRLAEREAQRKLWEQVTDFAYRPELEENKSFSLKLGVLPTQIPATLEQAKELAGQSGLELQALAHAGHGIVYLTGHEGEEEAVANLIGQLSAKVEAVGGSLTAEGVPLSVKHRLDDVWGHALSEGELKLMRGIKEKLDPNFTLNPGRFVSRL